MVEQGSREEPPPLQPQGFSQNPLSPAPSLNFAEKVPSVEGSR